MVLSWLTHTREIPDRPRLITYRYLSVDLSRLLFWGTAEIFVLLHIIQSLPPAQVGIIFSIQYALITFLDYPTGSLADSIGHRTVLLIAHFFRIIFFVLLFFANSFSMFVIVIIVGSFSFSQESGALESWYDNNYKYVIEDNDVDRIHYTAIKGRLTALRQSIAAVVFVLGGLISSIFNRQLLFIISALGFVFVFILDIVALKPTPHELETKRKSMTTNLVNGLKFTVHSKSHIMLFGGFGLMWGSGTVWYLYLLFQTYDSYAAGEDFYTSLLRTTIYVIGIPLSVLATKWSKNMKNTEKWMIITFTIGGSLFYIAVYGLFELFPPENQLHIGKYFMLIAVFTVFGGIWFTLMQIMSERFFLDFYPDEIRNSMFSFSSSLASLIAIPVQILISSLVALYTLKIGILSVGIFGLIGTFFVSIALLKLKHAKIDSKIDVTISSIEKPFPEKLGD